MGTHPIFESDFDCLTEGKVLHKLNKSEQWPNFQQLLVVRKTL